MLTFLYTLLIKPLVFMIELIYMGIYRVLLKPGLAIIGLSLVVNFLILPLYRRADALQEAERSKQDSMKHWVDHIKKTFKGDERYMLLQTYYRQQNYHPLYALKSSISLLLQIPFFIGAYLFLSNLTMLKGCSFGPIPDLGSPDGMLTVAGITINVLPILMTVINLVSGAIYSKGFPLSSKLQQLALTLLFLVLLYDRPAGLVLYWTLNNLFSLGKNIFLKVLKHPKEVFAAAAAVFGTFVFYKLFRKKMDSNRIKYLVLTLVILVTYLPLVWLILQKKCPKFVERLRGSDEKPKTKTFLLAAVFLTLLIGFLIPLSVITASPIEFVNKLDYHNPIRYPLWNTVLAAGLFLVWGGIFYYLASNRAKRVFCIVYFASSVCAIVNYMAFGKGLGQISSILVFDDTPMFPTPMILANLLLMIGLIVLCLLIWRFRRSLVPALCIIGILGIAGLSVSNLVTMQSRLASEKEMLFADGEGSSDKVEPIFRLSTKGKNVIVLMMDRAIGYLFPYILKQRPELKEQLSGFTWYSNTLAYGTHTNFGSPPLYGGYEYTPLEMNRRSDLLLVEKQNQALKLMPILFEENGYEVTICDPPYAGYTWTPDLSVFSDFPDMKTYNTMGSYASGYSQFDESYSSIRDRNFFFYSVMKTLPLFAQRPLYDDGRYCASEKPNEVSESFLKSYTVLQLLPELTEISDEEVDTFLSLCNKATHETALLQMPDFELTAKVDNSDYFDPDFYEIDGVKLNLLNQGEPTGLRFKHFCINVASFMQIGKWFDYLREKGVYDNTRIIICSDHGYRINALENIYDKNLVDAGKFDCLLMVKDFGDTELKEDHTFMTNADVPTLTFEDLILDPVNPFTGKAVNSDEKTAHPQIVTDSDNWKTTENNSYAFDTKEQYWYTVEKDVLDLSNWRRLGTWPEAQKELAKMGLWP